MGMKYEVVNVDQTEITVDVSLLAKTEEMFFNATDMARPFGKKVKHFLALESTKEYMGAIFKGRDSTCLKYEDLVKIKRGKYGGTWLHNELAFEFAGWCSPIFRRNLHKWVEERLKKESEWKRSRLEAKTGFLPMTNAIAKNHDPAKHYHFSNEADLINRIVFGMPSKQFKEQHEVDNVRDACTAAELLDLDLLQRINTGLIELGMPYSERKERLAEFYQREQQSFLEAS